MAEKKKETKKKPEEEKKKKNISNENKKAVSSKKGTAKVVSKKTNKKPASKKKTTPKEEAIKAIDEELLDNKRNIKNQYKKEAIEKLAEEKETTQVQEEKKEEVVHDKGVLDELIGPPEPGQEANEDTGLFSSKVVWYLFFILFLIVGCMIYIYNEEAPKNKAEADEITNTKKELIVGENNLPSFSQEDAIEAINNYYSVKKNVEYLPLQYLQSCGLTTPEKAAKYAENKSGVYFKTDILYDDLRKIFENFISRECFEKTFRKYYKNSSGMVSCMTGQGILREYEIKSVVTLEAPSGRPALKVTYSTTADNEGTIEKTNTFEFKVIKGIWVINNII